MHFKHPDVLYFLFLLIIPILVHLFQLRRFKKEFFTNVRFLKELSIQTRKSSKIKKWLLLCTRLLILACIIIAFAQPFFQAKDSKNTTNELYIVLDNSFSMQARGQQGELLQRAVQDLLQHVPEGKTFSLLTNGEVFWNTDIKAVMKDLQQIKYSAIPFNLDSQLAKIKSRRSPFNKDVLIISDTKGVQQRQLQKIPADFNTIFFVPKAEQKSNISIDSVYISGMPDNFYELTVNLSAMGDHTANSPIAVYNQEKLIAKTMTSIEGNKKLISFMIPRASFDGYVSVDDQGLQYDNRFYFSISEPEKTNIISIGSEAASEFMNRIYSPSEFNYKNYELSVLPYNQLEKQDVIILNEIDRIPVALQTTIRSFIEKGGSIIFIPSENSNSAELNSFFQSFSDISFADIVADNKLITKISYGHPLYQGVFEKAISNFQYPSVKKSFGIKTTAPTILAFEDQSKFLAGLQKDFASVYVFSAPLNKTNANFLNSPLIVPTFFNMGKSRLQSGVSALTIGNPEPVIAKANIGNDEIVEVLPNFENGEKFIPMQTFSSGKVRLTFGDLPAQAGSYGIYHDQKLLRTIGFNYSRSESTANDLVSLDGHQETGSIESAFDTLQADRTDNELWKWFAIACLMFLAIELFIQKFVK